MKHILSKIILTLLISLTIFSCRKDRLDILDSDSLLRISLTTPLSSPGTKTEEVGSADQQIQSVHLFFFKQESSTDETRDIDSDQLYSVVKGESITHTTTANIKTFDVKLKVESQHRDDIFYCYAITNLSESEMTIDFITTLKGKTYSELYASLQKSFDKANQDLIMWGESSTTFQPSAVTSLSLNLLRSVARVDVGVGEYTGSGWSNTTTPTFTSIDFLLKEVYIYRPNIKMSYMPLGNTKPSYNANPYTVIQPSDITGQATIDAPTQYAVSAANITTNNFHEGIYTPESDVVFSDATPGNIHHLDRCAIVVGGSYKSSPNTSYYRVDFKDSPTAVMNVLRNHLYRVIITGVLADGYETPKEAYESKTTNISTTIQDWNEQDQHIIFDGQNWFSIEKKTIVLPGSKDATGLLSISSSMDVRTWQMGLGSDALTTNSSVENDLFTLTKPSTSVGGVLTVTTKKALLPTETQNASILTIKAGRLEFSVNIYQRHDASTDWTPEGDYEQEL